MAEDAKEPDAGEKAGPRVVMAEDAAEPEVAALEAPPAGTMVEGVPEESIRAVAATLAQAREAAEDDADTGLSIAGLADETDLEVPVVQRVVEVLADAGSITEYEPGLFRLRQPDDGDDAAEVAAEDPSPPSDDVPLSTEATRAALRKLGVSEATLDAAVPVEGEPAAEEDRPAPEFVGGGSPAGGGFVEVCLPAGVAEALDPSVLGEMVAKGVEQAQAKSRPFRLVVV